MRTLKLVNWNVEWAPPRGWKKALEILRRIEQHDPDVLCLTETQTELWTQEGHTICSQPDYGYSIKEGRRKVLLWSKEPWEHCDDLGSESLPPGRFVSGVTQTPVGEVTVIGVCIPWKDSRTETGRKLERKTPWEDHRQYLSAFARVLQRSYSKRLIVVGDFNQRIRTGSGEPSSLLSALQSAFSPRMTIATAALAFQGRRTIDHIALGEDLAAESLGVISNIHGETKLSDHFGVVAELSAKPS